MRNLKIATGLSRKDVKWKNIEITWDDLINRLSQTTRTRETSLEYSRMPKDKQSTVKDVGGFVGGHLAEGRRKNGNILSRSLLTLDADFATSTFWSDLVAFNDYACCVYSTHKHSSNSPRLRLVIPLSRDVTAEEYEAIARRIAFDIGIELFDDTTYQPTRLMYWPSTSMDAEFYFKSQEGDWLDPDDILAMYTDWKDVTTWPQSSRVSELHKTLAKKQGDPLDKEGLIGAFCKTYSIQEAIEKFIPNIYEPCTIPNRYTYINGSTAAGVVIYDDKFSYSNHATDPTSGKLCNAFDLIRIHKFNDLDTDVKEDTPANRRPSFKAMSEFVSADKDTKNLIAEEKILDLFGDVNSSEEEKEQIKEDYDWMKQLTYDKWGNVEPTSANFKLIIRNDYSLRNVGGYNLFTRQIEVLGALPWNSNGKSRRYDDFDDAGLRSYIEDVYKVTSPGKLQDAISIVQKEKEFHSVRDYINATEWDDLERIDTMLIDYLGAEDTQYVRQVSRKFMIGALARVFAPGCKMDNSLILVGKQGTGKSTFIRRLACFDDWYSDSIFTFNGKESLEAVQGKWIIELAELSAIKGSEIEKVKQFISKTVDDYRGAYKRHSESSPRQCVFIGSTNEQEFLRDATGNRRFWPVDIDIAKAKHNLFDNLNKSIVKQLWAEAKYYFLQGESWHADSSLSNLASEYQEKHSEESAQIGLIREYLDRLLPDAWNTLTQEERIEFFQGYSRHKDGTYRREKVCLMEIWIECFGGAVKDLNRVKQLELNSIMKRFKDWEYSSNPIRFTGGYGRQKGYRRLATIIEDGNEVIKSDGN